MIDVDLVVIGWGKAGKTLAGKYAASGKTVALVERSPKMYGGTCINVACVPTKDLITSAERRRPEDDAAEFFARAVTERDDLIGMLNAANHAMLERPGVHLLDGTARFVDAHTVSVATSEGEVIVRAETIVIGTGATPARLPIPGADLPGVYDSTTIQHANPFPRRLTVIGGGFIGLEFANMFAHFGAEVTVHDAGEEFLPRLDSDVADTVKQTLESRGIRIENRVQIDAVERADDGTLTVRTASGGHETDAVLMATGRVPATADLDLSAAGIDVDERGFIVVDDQLRTSAQHVFAVGDVNGGPQFTYISFDDNRIVWDAIQGKGIRRRSDRVAVPTTTFITPPLSQVGMTKEEARRSGRSVLVASKPVAKIAAMPRPKILGETHGVITILVDADDHTILGATVFATDSQEVINLLALGMRLGVTVDDLRDGIWTHPSSTEALNEVLSDLQPLE